MGDSLETRISTVEHIQEEFGHDIQEMKGQLAKLTKLIEGHTAIMPEGIHGSSFNPLQSSARILWYNIIIVIQTMNLKFQSGATFHREFITRIGSPMRLLRQPFQLLERRPNQLIMQTVQGTISGNQEGIEKRRDWILFQSHTPSYFPNY